MNTRVNRNQLIASAAGTLEILEILGAARGGMSLSAVVQASGKPKGTVHRMLATLVNTGFVVQDPRSSQYSLTLKLWRLGAGEVGNIDVVKVAGPWLERLVAETDETVHLSMLEPSGEIVYVSKVESPRSIRVQTRLGQRAPAWCTATGRSLLAFNREAADRVLAQPLRARTPGTVTDAKRLRALLKEVATRGYAVARAENHPEMGGIAAPVRDHGGSVLAACGVAIPAFRMNKALIDRCIPHVMRTAAAISAELGFHD